MELFRDQNMKSLKVFNGDPVGQLKALAETGKSVPIPPFTEEQAELIYKIETGEIKSLETTNIPL